jgi:hypothetical protein
VTVTLQPVVAEVMTEVDGSTAGVMMIEPDLQMGGIGQLNVGHSRLPSSMNVQACPCHSVDVAESEQQEARPGARGA